MRKKKHALETKIKHVNREIEVINEEIIRSFQKHLKGRFCRNDAYLFMLQEMKNKGYWVLNSIDLGYDQAFGFRDIYSKKFLCYNITYLFNVFSLNNESGRSFNNLAASHVQLIFSRYFCLQYRDHGLLIYDFIVKLIYDQSFYYLLTLLNMSQCTCKRWRNCPVLKMKRTCSNNNTLP